MLDIQREASTAGGILGSSPSTEISSETKGKKNKNPVLGVKKEASIIVKIDSSPSVVEIRQQKMRAATAASKALRSLSYSRAVRRDLYLAGGIPLLAQLTTTTITAAPSIQDSGPTARQTTTLTGKLNALSLKATVRTQAIPSLVQSSATATATTTQQSISAANAQQLPNTTKAK